MQKKPKRSYISPKVILLSDTLPYAQLECGAGGDPVGIEWCDNGGSNVFGCSLGSAYVPQCNPGSGGLPPISM